ncbi:peroxin 14/17 [Seiridium cupressi]
MSDSKETAVPRANEAPSTSEVTPKPNTTLDQARKFLSDDNVRSASKEKKTEFLKSKGLTNEDIETLLNEESSNEESKAKGDDLQSDIVETKEAPQQVAAQTTSSPTSSSPASETPPIITYPEFLTHTPKPPPLLTPTRLLNTATVLSTAWTVAYGAARFVVGPMADTLSESRSEYYDHVNTKLSTLVEKLEGVVSEVPYKNGKPLKSEVDVDDDSSDDDPTEMFHRDIGTQTSPPASTTSTSESVGRPVDEQASRLAQLTASLKDLSNIYTSQAENSSSLQLTMREIREDVDKLAYPGLPEYSSLYGGSGFGIGRSVEPEDEMKKTKDAIRSVKGMFLSSRMFPAAAAR